MSRRPLPYPDLILYNGKIRTFVTENSSCEALACAASRIVATGNSDDVRRLAGPETQMIDLADAVDEQSYVVAEALLDLGQRARRVLDDVVQQRRFDRAGVEVQPGENLGYGDGMRDIRIAVAPLLALVRLGAELVGLADAGQVAARQVALELSHETAEVVGPPHRRHNALERGGTIVHGG